jgi:hypothetical protein
LCINCQLGIEDGKEAEIKDDQSNGNNVMTFNTFDIQRVLAFGAPLLASGGQVL